MVGILLFRAIRAYDAVVDDVLLSVGRDVALVLEKNGLGGGDKGRYFFAKGSLPNVLILLMFHQVTIFQVDCRFLCLK